jgi:hypothetical protein
MQTKWRHFLKTLGNPDMPFADVIEGINIFLLPIWNAIKEENELLDSWHSNGLAWN